MFDNLQQTMRKNYADYKAQFSANTPQALEALLRTSIGDYNKRSFEKHDGVVYFVLAPLLNRVKIGWSGGHPNARISVIQTGSPEILQLLKGVYGNRTYENYIHRSFTTYRTHNEWFEYRDELKEFIDNLKSDI